jgi:hypothetical protein
MEVKINLAYQQILEIIKQFPISEVKKLVIDAQNVVEEKEKQKQPFAFDDEFLLSAPIMSDEQYEEFLENRKHFSQWRKK